jgi:uncharacterized protein YqeY
METPQQRIESEVKAAMKSGEKERLGVLRMLLSDLKNERIRLGAEVDEAGFLGLVRKAVKRRQEASESFRKGDRLELAEKEEREAVVLESYLPKGPSEAEVRAAIETFLADAGLSGPAAMGKVMGAMKEHFAGLADNATVSRIAREVLAP